jgi:hypothetical protein
MHPFSLVHKTPPQHSLAPAADAAGRTGAYVDSTRFHKLWAVFYVNQGNAATVACLADQRRRLSRHWCRRRAATVTIYTNLDGVAGTTYTKQTSAANYTTDAGVKVKVVILEFTPEAAWPSAGSLLPRAPRTPRI